MQYEEIIISSWEELTRLDIEFPLEIFRGQADANWPIVSSLLRTTNPEDDPNNDEFWMLRNFKRGIRNYLSDLPKDDDYVGWLSLMQHYGAPTRLIDFTHSFYVACYFALINSKSDAAVWAIDHNWLLQIGHQVFELDRGALKDEWEDSVYRATNIHLHHILNTANSASNYSEYPTHTGVVAVEPMHSNQRLSIQQGLFLLPLNTSASFLENLELFERNSYQKFKKIIIKHEVREVVLAHLAKMNITSETLFPGVEGFTKSIVHKQMLLCNN